MERRLRPCARTAFRSLGAAYATDGQLLGGSVGVIWRGADLLAPPSGRALYDMV
jgi:hypothetical protein